MPRNGSGSYGLPAGNPVVPSTVISSTWANTTLSDIGTALTQSIANDGQTVPVANLPMATFRHTNVGNAVARNDYAAAGQVQDSSLQWLTSVAGTDTITAIVTPSPSAYVAGQTFRFVSAGANTTATPTLNINGLGAKTIKKRGSQELVAGDIASGQIVEVVYDGTNMQLVSLVPVGRQLLKTVQAAGLTNIDFTGLDSTYDMYEVVFTDLVPTTDNVFFVMHVSNDNGTTWRSDNTYSSITNSVTVGGSPVGITFNATTQMTISGSVTNAADAVFSGVLRAHGLSRTSRAKVFNWEIGCVLTTLALFDLRGTGGYFNAANKALAINAIRFFFGGTTFSAGTFSIYGVNK